MPLSGLEDSGIFFWYVIERISSAAGPVSAYNWGIYLI